MLGLEVQSTDALPQDSDGEARNLSNQWTRARRPLAHLTHWKEDKTEHNDLTISLLNIMWSSWFHGFQINLQLLLLY